VQKDWSILADILQKTHSTITEKERNDISAGFGRFYGSVSAYWASEGI